MKDYRTQEQFDEIVEDCLNGNWKDAAKLCVENGFYASDLIRMNDIESGFNDLTDIAELIEIATRLRYEK